MKRKLIVWTAVAIITRGAAFAQETGEVQPATVAEVLADLHMLGLEMEAFATDSAEAFAAREDFVERGDVSREDYERDVFRQDQWRADRATWTCLWDAIATEDLKCVREFYEGKVEQAANLARSLNVSQAGVRIETVSLSVAGVTVTLRIDP